MPSPWNAMTSRLGQADVSRLLSDPSPQARIDLAAKVADQFDRGGLNERERQIAEDIFRAMVKDAEVRVREALSEHLKATPDLPHEIVLALAHDVDSVALPVLKSSEILTDADLIEIMRGPNPAKQVAIAQRASVSTAVADAIVDSRNVTAVARLVGNEGADIGERTFDRMITEYGENEAVSDGLARRPNMPAKISERVVSELTGRLQDYLLCKTELSPDAVSTLLLQARERATVSLLSKQVGALDLEQLVVQLHKNNRLTPSLVLRALCLGDMAFFEMAMSKRAGVPLRNAQILIHDQGTLGLESLYLRAGFPEKLYVAFRAAVDVARETHYDGDVNDRERYLSRMLERVLTHCGDDTELADEDVDFLVSKLKHMAA